MIPLHMHRRSSNIGVLLLLMQICQTGLCRIPPITLGIIFLNSGIYLGVFHALLGKRYPNPVEVCVGIQQVWKLGEYWRLFEASFYHGDDLHLYFNMISFLWKGISMECRMGSRRFLFLVSFLSVSVNILMLYLNYMVAHFVADETYLSRCAIGFSGVVFALKVVNNHMMPCSTTYFLGCFPVSSNLSFWFELFLIQVLVPNASFTGHLAGILLGLAFIKEPLRNIICSDFSDACCESDPCSPCAVECQSSDSCNTSENSDDDVCSEGDCGVHDNTNFFPFMSQGYNQRPGTEFIEGDEIYSVDQEPLPESSNFDDAGDMRRRRLERFGSLPNR